MPKVVDFFGYMCEWGVEIRKQRSYYEGKYALKKALDNEKEIENKCDEILLYFDKIT